MTVVRIVDADKEALRQKRIIIGLFSIGFLGLSYLVYDYTQIISRTSIPEGLTQVEPIIEKWQTDGLVQSFDATRAKLIVHEQAWQDRKKEEKVGIVTQLARYCAQKNNSSVWTLTVVGSRNAQVLGEFGSGGLIIK